jgi:hypothetical protein
MVHHADAGVEFRRWRLAFHCGLWLGEEGDSVVPATPPLRPSAEWYPLIARKDAMNGAPKSVDQSDVWATRPRVLHPNPPAKNAWMRHPASSDRKRDLYGPATRPSVLVPNLSGGCLLRASIESRLNIELEVWIPLYLSL